MPSNRPQPSNTTQSEHKAASTRATANVSGSHAGHTISIWTDKTVYCETDSRAITPELFLTDFARIMNS
jgi:hypothetical protein